MLVECTTPISLKKCFHCYWRLCLYMCTRAWGFSKTVAHSVLQAECITGMISFQMEWPWTSDHLASTFSQPPHFYLWGCLKETVYATEFWDHDDLIKYIEVAAAEIRNVPTQLVTIRVSIWCHCEAYVQKEGGQFEHLWCDVHTVYWQVGATW
jgi:hypothetical protein